MKPFLIRLTLFGCLQMVIGSGVLMFGNPADDEYYYCAIYDKVKRLEHAEQMPRLLLVGGSNVAFGIDSCELADENLFPVNMGLHAGLGIDFNLKLIRERVQPDDIVVLCLEYELLLDRADESIKQEMVTACPGYVPYVYPDRSDWQAWRDFLDSKALSTARCWVEKSFQQQPVKWYGIYRRSSFNEYGDMVAHAEMPPQPKIDYDPLTRIKVDEVAPVVKRLNEFATQCRAQGASVYLSYPPMPRHRFAASRVGLHQLQKLLDRELEIPQIDRPSDHVYSADEFFDTYYHLTAETATRRTRKIRDSLLACRTAETNQGSLLR